MLKINLLQLSSREAHKARTARIARVAHTACRATTRATNCVTTYDFWRYSHFFCRK